MSLEAYKTLIGEFGGKLGVGGLAADDEGYVALEFDDQTIHLQYEPDEDEVVVFTRLGQVEELRAEQIYQWLLGANLFWQGGKGATFSLEPDSEAVFMSDRKPMEVLRIDRFVPWIERFIDVSSYWRRRLDVVNAGGPLDDTAGEEPPPAAGPQPGDVIFRA